jgi:mevalonate kinase
MLIEINHSLLQCCGVGHEKLDQIVSITKRRKLCTKITGAGGGGCALTLIPSHFPRKDIDLLISELESLGFSAFLADLGAAGVTIKL